MPKRPVARMTSGPGGRGRGVFIPLPALASQGAQARARPLMSRRPGVCFAASAINLPLIRVMFILMREWSTHACRRTLPSDTGGALRGRANAASLWRTVAFACVTAGAEEGGVR